MYKRTQMRTTALLTLITVLTLVQATAADDREALIGTWEITTFQDDGRDRLERLGVRPAKKTVAAPQVAKLVFTADECYILRGDGRREMASGLANAGFRSCKLDASTSPRSIDVEGFSGKQNEKTKTYLGIYTLGGRRADDLLLRAGQDASDQV